MAALDALPEGRVTTVMAGTHPVALTHVGGEYGALCNQCPHQGGPLGEGTLENGVLRCPWHGWDFDPLTGYAKDAHADRVETYRVDIREDGVYVGIAEPVKHVRTVSDVMAETMALIGPDDALPAAGSQIRLATKYPKLAKRFVATQPWGAEIFKLSGSVELGPLLELSEMALDIVQTGQTLRDNGLVEVEVVEQVNACLVVNRASYQRHRRRINDLMRELERKELVL